MGLIKKEYLSHPNHQPTALAAVPVAALAVLAVSAALAVVLAVLAVRPALSLQNPAY
jgi:high-affinity Fe2+/Pb2+ permease